MPKNLPRLSRASIRRAAAYADEQTQGLTLVADGNGNTVLAPAITDWFRDRPCPGVQGYVEFDCTMNTNQSGLISGSGCAGVANEDWDGDHKVVFTFTAGQGNSVTITVDAQKALSANNQGIRRHGNRLAESGEKRG